VCVCIYASTCAAAHSCGGVEQEIKRTELGGGMRKKESRLQATLWKLSHPLERLKKKSASWL